MELERLGSLVEPVKALCVQAAGAIEKIAAGDKDVRHKSDGSPLTAADEASDRIIVAGLRELGDWPVVSEEGDLETSAGASAGAYWLVDPLDGTKEFVKGLPEYTVNVALIHQAQPVLGVIVVPPTRAVYWACRGGGAFKSLAGQVTPLRPAARLRPTSAVVSRSHLSAQTGDYLERLGVSQVVPSGSSLKICAVAEGLADFYPRLGPIWYWDTAAGAAIAIEAGCDAIDLAGRALRYDLGEGMKHQGFIIKPSGMDVPLP